MTNNDFTYTHISLKTQTILYEKFDGTIDRFYLHESNGITHDEASDILKSLNIQHEGILRVITERVVLRINRLDHQKDTIVSTETYYNNKK